MCRSSLCRLGPLRLRLDLRGELLEICPAAGGVEIRLLQLAGIGPADLDGPCQGGDGLTGERLRFSRRHAGFRVDTERGQKRQRPRPPEPTVSLQVWGLGP
jgi:hypothetical protein